MKQFWINLPVKNITTSKAFFTAIGFRQNPMHQNASNLASFFLSDQNVVMMLFEEAAFKTFTQNEIAETQKGTEVLLNIDAQSKEEVDALAKKVLAAGGQLYAAPSEADGWMYAMGFIDPDGHRWSILYMDLEKMPSHS
ncbi:MAG TPA: extradiol dioxygenase [Flavobacteriaceae bacterium]|nr:extradiol dioxygenase [Flavobacteriaceae bacterium]MCB9213606.1 extradiol dioxygenase [Alteromonas sp.]HPF12107.1 extradiol dioxygenase [Flavobacteriaceae bacterium]HQU21462.1 extradiol dioxygenase [Flavobacteriaceae bacterium]HQU65612.1 extradiol dioxygenase [Flavobacteriaceae bacterium]